MGKYIRKAKATGDLAVMEVPNGGGGVRTRAAALAAAAADSAGKSGGGGASYIQLRSRLLIKKPTGSGVRRRRRKGKGKGKEDGGEEEGKDEEGSKGGDDPEGGKECGGAVSEAVENGEGSCGDNALELEGRERSTRESTPCSLIRDTNGVSTPSSTTKPMGLIQTNRRGYSADRRDIASAHEMDDFFASAEEEQQKSFIDKYNFDPVNEKPLPGRFEWEKLDPQSSRIRKPNKHS